MESRKNWAHEGKDEKKQLQHFSLFGGGLYNSISAVRWNPSNQDEVLSRRPPASVFVSKGLSDIAFLNDGTRVLASDISGAISMWDRRASVHPQRVLTTKKRIGLTSIQSLGDQEQSRTYIRRKGIQSININSSCPYQLGFHLNDGWSGVLDIIYAVASTSSNGLHVLDFYPHSSSPCHVDYDDSKSHRETVKHKQSVFVPLSKRVTSCAIHPLNGTIVAGTMNASLLTISQKHLCKKGDGEDEQS
ncbi:uncharacterized protein LOC110907538 [Helianthus annuus]|uniref:uncharacterized protein LOC110907538 n=1 Tax=Helianthus annuus TaxID=4232 RepID=UPI001653398B|nr:uncharacterized protein LOC110907538 [Helianthus annuus]